MVSRVARNGVINVCGVHPNYAGMVAEWYRIELANLVRLDPLPKILEQIFGFKIGLPDYGYCREALAKEIMESTYALC